MEIFYLKKSRIYNILDFKSLEYFSDNRRYSSQDKYYEHLLGLFLARFVAKNIYNIENTEIELKNKKPCFRFSDLNFSISHSQDVILCAFSKNSIGADVEYIRERDFSLILSRYGDNIENPTKEYFYKFWTKHEALIKLGVQEKSSFNIVLEKDYMLTCVSDAEFVSDFCIREIIFSGKKIDLNKEYFKPENCGIIDL